MCRFLEKPYVRLREGPTSVLEFYRSAIPGRGTAIVHTIRYSMGHLQKDLDCSTRSALC